MIGIFVIEKKGLEDIKQFAAFFIITFISGLIFTPIIYLFLRGLSIDAVFIHVGVFSIPALVVIPFGVCILLKKDKQVIVNDKISIEDRIE